MTTLTELWLPILLSAVAVFVISSIIHMASPWHKNDYPRMPREDDVVAALRPLAVPPGDYMVPRPASQKDLRTPEFLEKLRQGPVMMVTVMPNGMMDMRRNLALWFLYLVVIALFAAYIAGRALPHGAPGLRVVQLAGATAFIGYGAALWQMSIWYRRSWSITAKATIDGLIYAVITAGVLAWGWPG